MCFLGSFFTNFVIFSTFFLLFFEFFRNFCSKIVIFLKISWKFFSGPRKIDTTGRHRPQYLHLPTYAPQLKSPKPAICIITENVEIWGFSGVLEGFVEVIFDVPQLVNTLNYPAPSHKVSFFKRFLLIFCRFFDFF